MTKPETNNSSKTPMANSRWRFMMPAVVIGLLGGHVLFIMTAITFATGDRSFAVVPDYYQKAVDYDERKALLAQSAALGWIVELVPSPRVDATGQRDLVVQIRDRAGEPIGGLSVQMSGYHLARASEPIAFECVELLPGQYAAAAPITKEGFWQFEVYAAMGEQRFVAEIKQFIAAAGGAK